MSKPPRDLQAESSNTYFITTTADGGRALFQSERLAHLFIAMLFDYRDQGKFQVHEFVVMPNHVHLLITTGEGVTLERAMQFVKGGFSFRAKRELGIASEIWQRGYVDHRVRDANDFAQHRAYIHANPVRVGIVDIPEKFPFSSAHVGFALDAAPQGLRPF